MPAGRFCVQAYTRLPILPALACLGMPGRWHHKVLPVCSSDSRRCPYCLMRVTMPNWDVSQAVHIETKPTLPLTCVFMTAWMHLTARYCGIRKHLADSSQPLIPVCGRRSDRTLQLAG